MSPQTTDAFASGIAAEAAADWFDGSSAASRSILVSRDGAMLLIRWPDGSSRRVDVSRLAWITDTAAPRPVLSDGTGAHMVLRTPEDVALLGLERSPPIPRGRLTRSWTQATAALVGAVVIAGLLLTWLLPILARLAVELTPRSMETQFGSEVLRELDRVLVKPSAIPAEAQKGIRTRFSRLASIAGVTDAQLHFRSGGAIGANAMALPGRNVLLTDELVMLLGDSPRLDAVLAHELGHVVARHPLGTLYKRGGVALIIGTIVNEPGLVTRILREGSSEAVSAGNSRHAEQEADAFAHRLLFKVGLQPSDLADALEVMQQAGGAADKRAAYFGTHPTTTDRIKAARSAR